MGEHEGWAQPSGLLPNGLLPNAGPLIRALDSERWSKAEERTAELIACIQPNQPSEERRNAVADYVQRLITKCFPCQVFTFGSVPLKTYLPDGDIDLTAFSDNQNLKETWANQVRDMLENEEKNENAEYHVKEVQYIQAEVKIIKCLVENIVVDISFNQLGGLCTLCFLEEVDHLINQNHLFKRSIILIKAWCYYESRILGAHHGLISTYALETLVLYIFHVFNNSFAGPLEVLYRFLEFFSNFDWDNFCVSLWGPVPVNSLPDVTAEPPRKDSGDLLLSKLFLNACSSVYAVFPGGQENQGQPFVSKHFNVIDPLRVNNNLGRSVSKGNFFRIRSAFAFGAKRLARLLDCPKENLAYEANQFFLNTWDRHGSGNRPDAPKSDLWRLRLPASDHQSGSENLKHASRRATVNLSGHDSGTEVANLNSASSQSTFRTNNVSASSRAFNQKIHGTLNSSGTTDVVREVNSNQKVHTEKNQRNWKPDHLVNDIQGRFLLARTCSSPELTDTYGDEVPQGRRNKVLESGKNQVASARMDGNRRKNVGSELLANHGSRSSNDDTSSVRNTPSHQSLVTASDSNSSSNAYQQDSGGIMNEERTSTTGIQGLHKDGQDVTNLMESFAVHGFNGQVHLPLNLASAHVPFPMSPSILASMGYAQRNLAGMVPTNIPFIDPAFSNMQFPQGLVSPQLTNYFPGIGLTSNSEESIEPGNENIGSTEMNSGEGDHDFWQEQEVGPIEGHGPNNQNFEGIRSDDKPQSTSWSLNFMPASHLGSSGGSVRSQQKYTKEKRVSVWEDGSDNFQYQDIRGSDFYSEDRTLSSKFSSAAHSSSMRSKTSSESSWDGSSTKTSKATKERRGKKTISAEPATGYGKGKTVSDHVSVQDEEDDQDWNPVCNLGCDVAEKTSGSQPVSSLHVTRHHMPGYEPAETSGSDSMITMAPMLIGPGSQQRMMDNSGLFAFVPTGPPVPFVTMLPVYNIPPETGASDASTSHFSSEEGPENSDAGQNFDSSEGLEHNQEFNAPNSVRGNTSVEASDEHKSDILNSDFASHWKNLQYGRFCQDSRYHGPMYYPSSVMLPPMYLQGRFPWDGPGRPVSSNMNLFSQLMNYGPHFVPVAPLQSVSHRPPSVYQRYVDDLPRYRSGTGTYLPNPKVSVRDRHSSGTRRGNYNYDRSDSHGDREGNWNINSRPRSTGRGHNRNQGEKSSTRLDRLASSESRADRSWTSHRHQSFSSYQTQNGPLRSNTSQDGHPNAPFSIYPLPTMNNGASSNEPSVPSMVMLYPFGHNAGYGLHAEQLEFGSLGPMGFSGISEQSQPNENRTRGAYEEHRFHGAAQLSSPEQPSSPHHQRSMAQRNYHLKDDFPLLTFSTQIENGGDRKYSERLSGFLNLVSLLK